MGLGKRLMDAFMEFVRERGYRKAYLWTTNEQHTSGTGNGHKILLIFTATSASSPLLRRTRTFTFGPMAFNMF